MRILFRSLSAFLALTIYCSALASVNKIPGDVVKIVPTTSGANPQLQLDSGFIRKNISTNKLEFSHDGTTVNKIGSGSGSGDGGINLLENASFEDGLPSSFWASSGGELTEQTYTVGAEGEAKYARFISTVAGEYFETTLKSIPSFGVGGCLAKINYNTTDSANWKIQVYDLGTNLLKEENLYAKNWQDGFASFPCPISGTLVKLRVISLGAGTIEADKAYLGKENRTFQTSYTGLVLSAYYDGATSCSPSASSSSAWVDFGTSSTCLGLTVRESYGGVTASTADIDRNDRITVSLPAGKYRVKLKTSTNNSSAVGYSAVRLTDGITNYQGRPIVTANADAYDVEGVFTYSTPSSITFKAQCYAVSPATGCSISNSVAGISNSQWEIERITSSSEAALVPEAQNWFIDANIGGANYTIPNSVVSSYSPIESSSWDMVLNNGSAYAEIGCSSTNSPSLGTCPSGSESYSVSFTPPEAGHYEVCTNFSLYVGATATNQEIVAQWVETGVANQTIIQEGNKRVNVGGNSANAGDVNAYAAYVCGTFKFDSVTKRTLRLMYEKAVAGAGSGQIFADRSASAGQRDLSITVRNLTQAYNRPYLTGDQVTSKGTTDNDVQMVYFGSGATCESPCTSGACSICKRSGTLISSVEHNGVAGGYRVYGIDGTRYICGGVGVGTNYTAITHGLSVSTSGYAVIQAGSGSTGYNVGAVNLTCRKGI